VTQDTNLLSNRRRRNKKKAGAITGLVLVFVVFLILIVAGGVVLAISLQSYRSDSGVNEQKNNPTTTESTPTTAMNNETSSSPSSSSSYTTQTSISNTTSTTSSSSYSSSSTMSALTLADYGIAGAVLLPNATSPWTTSNQSYVQLRLTMVYSQQNSVAYLYVKNLLQNELLLFNANLSYVVRFDFNNGSSLIRFVGRMLLNASQERSQPFYLGDIQANDTSSMLHRVLILNAPESMVYNSTTKQPVLIANSTSVIRIGQIEVSYDAGYSNSYIGRCGSFDGCDVTATAGMKWMYIDVNFHNLDYDNAINSWFKWGFGFCLGGNDCTSHNDDGGSSVVVLSPGGHSEASEYVIFYINSSYYLTGVLYPVR
jgi:hypothetical protein